MAVRTVDTEPELVRANNVFTKEILRRLDHIAKREVVTRSHLIRLACERLIAEKESQSE